MEKPKKKQRVLSDAEKAAKAAYNLEWTRNSRAKKRAAKAAKAEAVTKLTKTLKLVADLKDNQDTFNEQPDDAGSWNDSAFEEQNPLEKAKAVMDDILSRCKEYPGLLGTQEFAEALKLIASDNELWFEYRTRIKAAKPSGVPMADIDLMAGKGSIHEGDIEYSVAAELIELVTKQADLFYDSQSDKSYIKVLISDIHTVLAIGSRDFIDWVSFAYYSETKQKNDFGKSASEQAIKQAGFALSGIAKHDGQDERVYLRVADHNGNHYLSLGNKERQVIEVKTTGWRIIDKSPVNFWHPGSMQPLPIPKNNGDLSALWEFVNVPEADRPLVLAWILEAFRSETPKPIMALTGIQGSAKSSSQSKLRDLIDCNSANLRGSPKTVEDIFVAAGCNWLASYENLSHLSRAMQDALCTLATGGGHSTRKFYTNDEECIIDVKRPVILNSIPSVLTAQDVIDRTITLELPPITYREESELNAKWLAAKDSIFGGLLDLFVKTLAKMPTVKLDKPPRMADFTRLGEAMMQSEGQASGVFTALYKANRAEGISRALDASPVAVAVRSLVENFSKATGIVFKDTMKTLLYKLEFYRNESSGWPRSARGLGDALRRNQPGLKTVGVEVHIGKHGREGAIVTIKKLPLDG
jgi:hypothetical protein